MSEISTIVPMPSSLSFFPTATFPIAVSAWAEANLRDLPWRRSRDPWAILVAETMLQQTQVSRVVDRWARFVERFPDPATCSLATSADIVRHWEGLGYNRRAVMLHRCAADITTGHGGVVPHELDDLLALPGVGPYTARAVRAFAFELTAAPVDTNIGRVLARVAGRAFSPKEAQVLADSLVPAKDVWLYNQAVMELGAIICTKRAPACDDCPAVGACAWRGRGEDPAMNSAGASGPQSRFVGSDRQLRGRLIDALRRRPVGLDELAVVLGCDDDERRALIVDGLVGDGLVEVADGVAWLAGDRATQGRSGN